MEQHPLRRRHEAARKQLSLLNGQYDSLFELPDQLLEAGNVFELDGDSGGVDELAGNHHLVLGQLDVVGDAEAGEKLLGALLGSHLLLLRWVQGVNK